MRLRGSAIFLGSACAASLLLSGCAKTPIVQRSVLPNPFGYQRVSALCRVTPVATAPDGTMSVSVTVRSDDGLCAISIARPTGGNYASFGVNPGPSHGKAFLYNYDDHTIIDYTPATAYAGADSFTVDLIPGGGAPRAHLLVKATVDATGVIVHAPQPPAAPAAKTTPTAKTKARHVRTRHRH